MFDPQSTKIYRQKIRDDLKISNQSIAIAFIGRLESHKGVYELLEGIKLIQGTKPHLFLIGNPSERVQIEKFIRGTDLETTVHLIGSIPFNKIPNYLAASDIFILPSKHEGTPRVILEAMAMEIPVVASAVGGIPEVLEHGKTGFLLKDSEPNTIAQVLNSLVKHPEKRARIGKAARLHVIANYNFKQQAGSLINLHKSMVLEP